MDLLILSLAVEMVIVVPLSSRCPLAIYSSLWEEDFESCSNSTRARMIFSSCLKIFSIFSETRLLWPSLRSKWRPERIRLFFICVLYFLVIEF